MEKTHCETCAKFTVGTGFVRFENWVTTLIKAQAPLKSFLWDFVSCFGGVLSVEVDSASNPKQTNQGLHLKYGCIVDLMKRAGFVASEKTLKRNLEALVEMGILSKGVPADHSHFTRIYLLNTKHAYQWDHYAKELANAQLAQSKYKNQVRVKNEVTVDQDDALDVLCWNVAETAARLYPNGKKTLIKNVVFQYLSEGGYVSTAMIAMFDLINKADSVPFTHASFLQGLKSRNSTIPQQYIADIDAMNKKVNRIRLERSN
jgi:hypothetical protein